MQIAEFETVLQDGVISVPAEYLAVLPEKTRIMVKIEMLDKGHVYKRRFNAVRINTKGFKFNREEANER